MKNRVVIVFVISFLFGAGIFFLPGKALSHDVSLSVGIDLGAPPPPVVVAQPPMLYAMPGLPVYYVPQIERQLFFYYGNWYRLYDGYWFRAAYYNGPWIYLSPTSVPTVFIDISPVYYVVPPREMYVPYWKQRVYWKERERHHHEHRDEWKDRDHGNRDWERHDWKNWKDEKRDRKDYRKRYTSY